MLELLAKQESNYNQVTQQMFKAGGMLGRNEIFELNTVKLYVCVSIRGLKFRNWFAFPRFSGGVNGMFFLIFFFFVCLMVMEKLESQLVF